jgi:hypothetical protein
MYQVFQEINDASNYHVMLRVGRLLKTLKAALKAAKRLSLKALVEIRDSHNVIVAIFKGGVEVGGLHA